ncbi:Stk1 family PASTA domain-containing Ser/Thr kinase [Glaciihabitans sp. dw_435]|uniref:Stk1 family PASTA domain-containing Ser/Thr kinase n=1 Tax=Glaciihabitans sp. dw_435 TaxID=2720081 RepID=UPI001BD5B3CC|nr:Stk1 family PASTA domain-containing Ser/Thr kinase [Glaciihabitans sp. dw_435]
MTGNSTDPMVGRLIDGRYQVRSRIARGGMATVYLATDLRLERRVAIKIMHSHLADDSQFKERFIQEARSSARLAHPNVINVFDQGQDSDTAYLVMEYLPGITLRDLLQEHGKLTTEQTFDVLEAVLSGLSAAHKAGIVHRDLKPENVMLADDGRIKLGDFGLARAVSANTATGAALLGTIAYLSPELVTRGVADARSDIYAVGIMMYEMLTGEQPYKGEQPMQIAYQHANDTVPTPSSKNPKIPAELDELVLWATERDPEKRPRDARVMLDQLLAAQSILQSDNSTGSTVALRTMVLPTAQDAKPSNDATQVLRPVARHRTGPVVPDSATTLTLRSKKRRARGWWLFVLVLLLAGGAAGTGWYFGAGPGSQIKVTDVAGKSIAGATAALEDDGFVVSGTNGTAFSTSVVKGDVVETKPVSGTVVVKGEKVQLLVSQGPEQLPVPALIGKTEAEAKKAIVAARFTVSETPSKFQYSKSAKDTVIGMLSASGKALKAGAKYSDQQPIQLIVSSGPVPNVVGLTLEAAQAKLKDVGLIGEAGSQSYSDSIDEGKVIKIDRDTSQVLTPGTTLQLTISRGPQLIQIPSIIGKTWYEAKTILKDAGFTNLNYNSIADTAPGLAKVQNVDPGIGKSVTKDTEISISFTI